MATVLVIDDSLETRLLVKTVLAHAGHTVAEAANGNAGLAKAREVQPDLILLDLSLPGISGLQFVRIVRADLQLRSTRLALYTATPMNAALRDFMQTYAIPSVIAKPSEPGALLAAVEQVLTG